VSARPTFSSVQEYLAALEPHQRRVLKTILALVKKTVPDALPGISYGIPAFRLGSVFLYCAAFKNHIGIFPPVKGDARLVTALKPYANAKGNLSFRLDEAMPMPLITRVAKALAKQYARPNAPAPGRRPSKNNRNPRQR
jgi:uncharacterized protein YdhG (YjbR/CyaY superfamily)